MGRIINIIILICLSVSGFSQTDYTTPQEYFNEAAKKYIEDDKLGAVEILKSGLDKFDSNSEMLDLANELFKEMQEQQQQQQQQQDQEQEEQENNEQKQEQDKQDQQEGKDQDTGDDKESGEEGDQEKSDDESGENGEEKEEGENGEDESEEEKAEEESEGAGEEEGDKGEEQNQGENRPESGEGEQQQVQLQRGEFSKERSMMLLKAADQSEKAAQAKVIKKKGKSSGKAKKQKDW